MASTSWITTDMRKLLIVLVVALPLLAFAKAAYWGKTEMIQRSEIVAIVNISSVESTRTKGKGWTYSEMASATVERVLKGKLPEEVKLYGGENFICAQVRYKPGRHLVFLRHDETLLTGVNWHFGVRKIENDELEWFADERPFQMKPAKLRDVLAEIEAAAKKGSPQ
jgi:hypothetical protein